jgi:hypothetical protein
MRRIGNLLMRAGRAGQPLADVHRSVFYDSSLLHAFV